MPEGVLLIHISTRHMDLLPVIDRIAAELKLTAFLRRDAEVSAMERAEGREPSTWAILARQPHRLASFRNDSRVAIAEWRSPKANCGPTTTLYPSGAALVKSASRGLRDGVAVPLIAHY